MTPRIVLDLDPWQAEVVASTARVLTVMGGRGVGKTVGCARNKLIAEALQNVDCEYAYFSPSYAVAKREARAIARHRALSAFVLDSGDQPFPFVVFCTGSRLNFRSMDREDNTLGYHLDGAVADEVHKQGERAIDEVIRPQVAARRGWLLLIGQHDEDGEEGWINRRFFVPGQDPAQADTFRSWRIPSSAGRMFSGPEGEAELAMIRASTPEYVWRWQYLAEAVESQNKAFRAADILRCVSPDVRVLDRAVAGRSYVIGYDIGKVVDPSAAVVLEARDERTAAVVHVGIERLGAKHEEQAANVARLSRVFGGATVLCDSTGQQGAAGGREGDAYSKYYREQCPEVRPVYWTQGNKVAMIQALQLGIEQGRVLLPAVGAEVLVDQLRRYRFESGRSGLLNFHGPDGHDDDAVGALAMAYHGFLKGYFAGGASVKSLAGVL